MKKATMTDGAKLLMEVFKTLVNDAYQHTQDLPTALGMAEQALYQFTAEVDAEQEQPEQDKGIGFIQRSKGGIN